MNPTEISQKNLLAWARKMGFHLEDGQLPNESYFASACNTPARRRLWEEVISKVKDRRYIKKIDDGNDKEADLMIKIQAKKREADLAEAEMKRKILQLRERTAKLAIVEKSIREKQIKSLLFRRKGLKNRMDANEIKKLGETIHRLSTAPEDVTKNIAEGWVRETTERASSRLTDPALLDNITTDLETANMACTSTWNVLLDMHGTISEQTKDSLQDTRQKSGNLLEEVRLDPSWTDHLAKQAWRACIIDSYTLLLRGHHLKRAQLSAVVPASEQIIQGATQFIASIFSDEESLPILTDEELMKMRKKTSIAKESRENLQNAVLALSEQYGKWMENVAQESRKLEMLLAEISFKARSEAPKWRRMLQQRNELVAKHKNFLTQRSLDTIRQIPPSSPPVTIEDENSTSPKDLEWCGSEDHVKQLVAISAALEKKDSITLDPRRGAVLTRDLEKAHDRLQCLNIRADHFEKMLAAWEHQPFAEMIPSSVSVNRMNVREWKLQFELCSNSTKHDFSVASYASDL